MDINSGSIQVRPYVDPTDVAQQFVNKFGSDTMQMVTLSTGVTDEIRDYGMPPAGVMQLLFSDLPQGADADVIKTVIARFEKSVGGIRMLPIDKVEVDRSGDLGPSVAVVTLTVDRSRLTETMPLPTTERVYA